MTFPSCALLSVAGVIFSRSSQALVHKIDYFLVPCFHIFFSMQTQMSHLNTNLSLLSCPCVWQLLQNVPMDTGFLCDKAVVLKSIINWTLLRPGSGVCPSSLQYTVIILYNSTASKCLQEISKKIRTELAEPRDLIHCNHRHNEILRMHNYSQHYGRLVAADVRRIIYLSECYTIMPLLLLCFRNTFEYRAQYLALYLGPPIS